MGCHSSLSDDLSVHARIDSTGHVRLLWESSEEDNKCTHAPIFEKKFGKKVEDATKNSRERTARTLFTDLRSVALALECSDLNITEDNFVPTAKKYSRRQREATDDQIRSSKTTVFPLSISHRFQTFKRDKGIDSVLLTIAAICRRIFSFSSPHSCMDEAHPQRFPRTSLLFLSELLSLVISLGYENRF